MERLLPDSGAPAVSLVGQTEAVVYELSEQVRVDALPGAVYALVSDITRTGEWSPQCYRCEWDSDARGVGATFTGYNRTLEREWTTTSRVVRDEPGHAFEWELVPSGVRWGYEITPAAGGSLLREWTIFPPQAETFFAEKWSADAPNQIRIRHEAARAGITATLNRLKTLLYA